MLAKCVGRTKNVGELLSRVHLHCEAEGWVGWYIMHKVEKGTKRSWIKRYLSLVGEGRVSEAEHLTPVVAKKRGAKPVFTDEVRASACVYRRMDGCPVRFV